MREDVDEYVSKNLNDVNFAENCAYIIENKYNPVPREAGELAKMMGALMRYGYTIGDIKEEVALVSKRGNDE